MLRGTYLCILCLTFVPCTLCLCLLFFRSHHLQIAPVWHHLLLNNLGTLSNSMVQNFALYTPPCGKPMSVVTLSTQFSYVCRFLCAGQPCLNRAVFKCSGLESCLNVKEYSHTVFTIVTFADSYLRANIEFKNKACTRGKYYSYTNLYFMLSVFIYVYRHIYVRHVLAGALASLP